MERWHAERRKSRGNGGGISAKISGQSGDCFRRRRGLEPRCVGVCLRRRFDAQSAPHYRCAVAGGDSANATLAGSFRKKPLGFARTRQAISRLFVGQNRTGFVGGIRRVSGPRCESANRPGDHAVRNGSGRENRYFAGRGCLADEEMNLRITKSNVIGQPDGETLPRFGTPWSGLADFTLSPLALT